MVNFYSANPHPNADNCHNKKNYSRYNCINHLGKTAFFVIFILCVGLLKCILPATALAQTAEQTREVSQDVIVDNPSTDNENVYSDSGVYLIHEAKYEHSLYGKFYLEASYALSILTDKEESALLAETMGVNLDFGYGLSDNFMLFLYLEQNLWRKQDSHDDWDNGVFNAGIGLLWQVFPPHVFCRVAFGVSVLTFDSSFDDAGTIGFFADLAPVEFQWKWFEEHLVLSIRPLSVHIDMPVVHEPMIRYIQYRTIIGIGYQW